MVRLWDETDGVRVYKPKVEPVFTAAELEEEATAAPLRCDRVIVAWVDGVFYKAPEIKREL